MPTRQEILSKTKAKYPEYKDVPDDQLATALAAKYPEYAADLNNVPVPNVYEQRQNVREIGFPQMGQFPATPASPVFNPGNLSQSVADAVQSAVLDASTMGLRRLAPESADFTGGAESLSQGALNAMLANTPKAIDVISGGAVIDPNSPEFTSPYLNATGEVLGNLLPVGRIVKATTGAATGLKAIQQAAKEGFRTGSIYGAGAGVSQAAQAEDPELSDAVKSTLGGAGLGAAAGTVLGGSLGAATQAPAAIKAFAQRQAGKLDEKIAKAVEAKQNFETQLQSDIEQAAINRDRAAANLAAENEANALNQALSQEQLQAAQIQATRAGNQALNVGETLEPQISAAQAAYDEGQVNLAPLLDPLPAPSQPSEFGRSVASDIEAQYKAAKEETVKDYSAIKKALPEKQPQREATNLHSAGKGLKAEINAGLSSIPTEGSAAVREVSRVQTQDAGGFITNAEDFTANEFQDMFKNATPEMRDQLRQLAKGESKEVNPKYTWDNLQRIHTQFNDQIQRAAERGHQSTVRLFSKLKSALEDDMEAYADNIGTDAKALFDKARANVVAREEKFGTDRITPLLDPKILAKPNEMVKMIVKGNNAPVVNNLKEILTPDNFQQVQSQYVKHLFSPEDKVPFEVSHFVKQFSDMNQETGVAVFGKDGYQALSGLHDASKGLDSIQSLQKTINEAAEAAQKAENALQSAKTKAQETTIRNSLKSEQSKVLDTLDTQLEQVKAASKDASTLKKIKDLQKDIDDARNPGKVPDFVKWVTATELLLHGFYSGHPGLGALASAGTILGADRLGRAVITPVAIAAMKKAANSNVGTAEAEALTKALSDTLIRQGSLKAGDQELDKKVKKSAGTP